MPCAFCSTDQHVPFSKGLSPFATLSIFLLAPDLCAGTLASAVCCWAPGQMFWPVRKADELIETVRMPGRSSECHPPGCSGGQPDTGLRPSQLHPGPDHCGTTALLSAAVSLYNDAIACGMDV